MRDHAARRLAASIVAAGLATSLLPAAPPATATLAGTVLADDVRTPLGGAVVVVTGPSGKTFASAPTGADGAFTIAAIPPGRVTIALTTSSGTFPVATPLALAPGLTRGLHLALRSRRRKRLGAETVPAGGTGTSAMIAVLVGFVAAGAAAIHERNGSHEPASASSPAD